MHGAFSGILCALCMLWCVAVLPNWLVCPMQLCVASDNSSQVLDGAKGLAPGPGTLLPSFQASLGVHACMAAVLCSLSQCAAHVSIAHAARHRPGLRLSSLASPLGSSTCPQCLGMLQCTAAPHCMCNAPAECFLVGLQV